MMYKDTHTFLWRVITAPRIFRTPDIDYVDFGGDRYSGSFGLDFDNDINAHGGTGRGTRLTGDHSGGSSFERTSNLDDDES